MSWEIGLLLSIVGVTAVSLLLLEELMSFWLKIGLIGIAIYSLLVAVDTGINLAYMNNASDEVIASAVQGHWLVVVLMIAFGSLTFLAMLIGGFEVWQARKKRKNEE